MGLATDVPIPGGSLLYDGVANDAAELAGRSIGSERMGDTSLLTFGLEQSADVCHFCGGKQVVVLVRNSQATLKPPTNTDVRDYHRRSLSRDP